MVTLTYEQAIAQCRSAPLHSPQGTVLEVLGLIVEIGGLRAAVGDTLLVETRRGQVEVEVVGFRGDRLLTTPLGPISGVSHGARAIHTRRGATVAVSEALMGRVVDALGNPLDGGPALGATRSCPIHASPPDPFARKPICRQFTSGVRAIDAFTPLGVGQRVGIFAGAGVGKSTLLGMICRSSQADVNVVGLVGERGRELNDFIRNALGAEGLARSVIVAATSDQPPLLRARGAEVATAIAEYFRDQGKTVLLVMDSVTRYAMAMREAALAAGEPPATKGYPPSVFAALPRLLERAGNGASEGSITALYTVLVEGDDLSDPVADAVRSILDGHIVLSRQLAEAGHFPAIDISRSISRLATEVASETQIAVSNGIRELLAAHREAADLIQVGAYQAGSDPAVETALRIMPQLEQFLCQRTADKMSSAETLARLLALGRMAQTSGGR